MPVEIAVGPPVLSINNGATFMVTDLAGEIQPDTEQGVFADDTRFVSYYAISANGAPWQRLNSAVTAYYAARVYLTNPVFATEDGDVPAGTLSLVISRTIADGVHEDVDVANGRLTFALELAPAATWHTCCDYVLVHGQSVRVPRRACDQGVDTDEDRL